MNELLLSLDEAEAIEENWDAYQEAMEQPPVDEDWLELQTRLSREIYE